ncbi:carboxypeptidase-like regulatory domain-containing protein [Hydrogenophaga sp. BPS33]|uniref:carboxypeptidase-like regulatory domain-containing protein n=1 Tax=Hydrogenophaga sp. BPS33 TaxID=2651974 RepID=UPI001357FC07|nr:carboxypeptidase-like regulatory domain-containing protein [Hydrogenophaga sp. BPS33]
MRRSPRRLAAAMGLAAPLLGAMAQDAPAPPASAPAYVDRVIENLPPEPVNDAEARAYDREGLPRFLRLETRLGTAPFDRTHRARIGYGIFGLIETPNHGTLSVDGAYAPRDGSSTVTLRQRGMPLDGGWLTNNSLGVFNVPAPDITRQPSRIYVPSAIVRGLSTEWENPDQGIQLQAATGEPGQLGFLPANGFRRLPGQRTTVGGQWRINAADASPSSHQGWTVALRHEDARKVSTFDTLFQPGDTVDAASTLLALRHEGAEHRIQGQVVSTHASQLNRGRTGFWVDGEWDDGPRRHGAGAYRLDPELSWAQQALSNNIVGAYFRSGWHTRQWSAEGSIDWLDSIDGRNDSGYFATGSARWRLDRSNSLGVGSTVRHYSGNAWSTYGDWRFQNAWGSSGLRLQLTGSDSQADSRGLVWDQEWQVPQGWALSTSLGPAAYSASVFQPAETLWSAAVSMTAPLSPKAVMRGNFNTERSNTGHRRHSLNLGVHWRIDTRWSFEANVNRSTGRSRIVASLDPLAPLPLVTADSDRSFYAVLRYELEAGSRNVPLGGKSSDGGGRIAGTVYFDANRSGTQEASEQGVPNVTVYLDNRYAVRTDSQGRFEFPFVASGPRTVSVRSDSLPLPWNVVDQGQTKVDVRLRESIQLTIPVQRSE